MILSNKTAKDLWDALARHMLGSEYAEQDRKATVLYEYETFKATEGELSKEIVVVSSNSEGSEADDFSELKKITTLLAKTFNRRKFYSKPTNNNLRTSFSSQSVNKKQEFVKTDNKRVKKKDDEKKRDMSKVKCYNCKKEGHFAKDCKKAKVKDYEYYKTKMMLVKKDKDEQVLLAEDQAWMESSSDSDQEINANMVFMAQIEKVLSDSEASSSSVNEKISKIVQICLWIIDSGCSKHMTGNRALLTNFVENFLGTVRFGNNDFVVIVGYGDVVIGSMTIKKVYYVEGLGHNLFRVGQFCDKGLKVAFRKSTCFVRNEDGVDLLTSDRSSNLYTIALNKVASNSSTYSQCVERFMNYLEEQTDGEAMINSIKNGDQPLPRVTQVFIAGTSSTEQPPLKDKSMWSDQEKRIQKIDRLARSLLIQQNQGHVNDTMGSKKKTVVVTSDSLALIAEKTNVSRSKEKVVVSSDSEGSEADDFSELKKITALLAKAFNRKKFYSKPTNNNLRTSSTSQG
nr:integrase, catalytic region, zinc finger, CCHC-type, peptidase aspartic, catalytic [Tanacetum cinerariifolium]